MQPESETDPSVNWNKTRSIMNGLVWLFFFLIFQVMSYFFKWTIFYFILTSFCFLMITLILSMVYDLEISLYKLENGLDVHEKEKKQIQK
jgi:hypothetical protein